MGNQAVSPGPMKPVTKEYLKTFTNTFERGGMSSQFTLTVNADVNTYEDIYKFNLYGQDYHVWADSLVAGGSDQLWDNFMKSVPIAKGETKRPFDLSTDLARSDEAMTEFLKMVAKFFQAQKGLCGDIGLVDFPCPKKRELDDKKQQAAQTAFGKNLQGCSKSMNLGKHDQIMVVMEQRWTGLCVAGVKIPQTGIAQLDESKVTDQTLTWTVTEDDVWENLLPAFGATPKIPWPTNKADPAEQLTECRWWKKVPAKNDGIKSPDNVLKDYLKDYKTSGVDTELKKHYNNCFKGKNKPFLAALFYTRLFKKIEDGIKESAYDTGAGKPIEPFQNANFDYANGDIKWLQGAAWMQVYNTRVRSLFTTPEPTKEPTRMASSSLLEERIGSIGSNIFQPADMPGTILDLDSLEH